MRRMCLTALLVLVSMGGIAHADGDDPWEALNRPMFRFNDTLDRWALEPAAKAYDFVTPNELQRCIRNFFRNLRVPIESVNGLLQGKPVQSASDVGRFTVNTTIGLAGFLDLATYFGLERHDEDFGQTLAVWGVPKGPYLVIPLLGPSTVRDTGGLMVDSALTPTWYFVDVVVTAGSRMIETVNARSLVREDVEHARDASLDFYSFVRHAYLQHREALIHDRKEETRETDDSLYFPDETPK